IARCSFALRIMAKSGISDRTARPPCGLPREGQAGPRADTTILKSGGNGSVDHDVAAETRLGDEAHGVVPRKLPQLLLTAKRLLSGSAEPLRAHCGEEGGFVELVRANGTWMNFSHPDGCPAARSAP